MKAFKQLISGQVSLRTTEVSDLDFILTVEQHPDNTAFIRQWTKEQHLTALNNPDIGHFLVINARTCCPVGHVILAGLQSFDSSVEFRRLVISDKGCGYGRDAVRLVKIFAFEELTCHRLWLDVMLGNKRAYKLYRSEGFTAEGIHREAVRHRSGFADVRVMSILRNEYFGRLYQRPTRLMTDVMCVEEAGEVIIR